MKKRIFFVFFIVASGIVLALTKIKTSIVKNADAVQNLVYRYDLTNADWDTKLFVSTFQGIINQDGPLMYIYENGHPLAYSADIWFTTLTQADKPYAWLVGKTKTNIDSINQFLEIFRSKLSNVIIWDPEVPATLNVATTMAGVYGWPVISPNSNLYNLLVAQQGIPAFDLRGKFTGNGKIPNLHFDGSTDYDSSGSRKIDAYLWAKIHFLDTGLTNPRYFIQTADGWFPHEYTKENASFEYLREFAVYQRAFVFDLDPWDEAPEDDPGQTKGSGECSGQYWDLCLFEKILSVARNKLGNDRIEIFGFFPHHQKKTESGWTIKWKYVNKHGGYFTPTEWRNVEVISKNGGVLNESNMVPNLSLHAHAPKLKNSELLSLNIAPRPQKLENKTYILPIWQESGGLNEQYAGRLFSFNVYPLNKIEWRTDEQGDVIDVLHNLRSMNINHIPDLVRWLYFEFQKSKHDWLFETSGGPGYVMVSQFSDKDFADSTAKLKQNHLRLGLRINSLIDYLKPNSSAKNMFSQIGADGFIWDHVGEAQYWHKGEGRFNNYSIYNPHPQFKNGLPLANNYYLPLAVNFLEGPIDPDNPPRSSPEMLANLQNAKGLILELMDGDGSRDAPEINQPGQKPNFLILRGTGLPNWWAALSTLLKKAKPQYNFEFVDPYTFFYLLRRYHNNPDPNSFGDINWQGSNSYRYSFLAVNGLTEKLSRGNSYSVSVSIRNDGWDTWTPWNGSDGYNLGILFLDEDNNIIAENSRRTFTQDITPGQVYQANFNISVPLNDKIKTLKLDLVHENTIWFEQVGNLPFSLQVTDQGGVTPTTNPPSNTPIPTSNPTKPPTPIPFCFKCTGGINHALGNANCDSKVDLIDFAIWQAIYSKILKGQAVTEAEKAKADFNCQETDKTHQVDLIDFSIWKTQYSKNV